MSRRRVFWVLLDNRYTGAKASDDFNGIRFQISMTRYIGCVSGPRCQFKHRGLLVYGVVNLYVKGRENKPYPHCSSQHRSHSDSGWCPHFLFGFFLCFR